MLQEVPKKLMCKVRIENFYELYGKGASISRNCGAPGDVFLVPKSGHLGSVSLHHAQQKLRVLWRKSEPGIES